MSKQREYVISLFVGDFDVRVWCDVPGFSDSILNVITARLESVREAVADTRTILNGSESQEEIAERFAKLNFCSAVEVKSGDYAVVIYPDWP